MTSWSSLLQVFPPKVSSPRTSQKGFVICWCYDIFQADWAKNNPYRLLRIFQPFAFVYNWSVLWLVNAITFCFLTCQKSILVVLAKFPATRLLYATEVFCDWLLLKHQPCLLIKRLIVVFFCEFLRHLPAQASKVCYDWLMPCHFACISYLHVWLSIPI